jgi:Zn-dependent metalloprotease
MNKKTTKMKNKITLLAGVILITCSMYSQVKEKEIISKNVKGKAELINFSETKVGSDHKSINDFLLKQFASKNTNGSKVVENNGKSEFRLELKNTRIENKLESKKYQQFYNGIKVEFGIQNMVSENGFLKTSSGKHIEVLNVNTTPKLSENIALDFAIKTIGAKNYMWENKANDDFLKKEQKNEKATYFPKGELVIIEKDMFGENPTPVLAYKFDIYASNPISRDYVYIDANNGEVILTDPIIKHIQGIGSTRYSGQRAIETQQSDSQYKLRDYSRGSGIETYNMNRGTDYNSATDFIDNDNNWNEYNNANKDNAALDAHWGAEKTYDYFLTKHNRNSYDGNGAKIKSYVHFSLNYENAGWTGDRMIYGDGGTTFTPLTSIDVIGHEIGHGVCQTTAGLIYSKESGAINEGLSDIWGAMVEYFAEPTKQTYLIGEEIKIGGGALRSMSNPKSQGQPDTYGGTYWYDQNCTPTNLNDRCGVHRNSGVMNHWFYILSEGKTGTNDKGNFYSVAGIGKEKAAKIAYRAESVYFTSTTNYLQASDLTIQAAKDLYGINSVESSAVEKAWYAVGVKEILWVGVPSIEINLESDSNYVNISLIGASSTDIKSQKITSTTWTQIASTGGGHAGGSGFTGFGNGPNFYWTSTLKITATNSYGTTEIIRDVTCAPPTPCNTINYSFETTTENNFIINQIIIPCEGVTGNEVSTVYDGTTEIRIYNFQGTEVLKSKGNKIDLSPLNTGMYIIKATIDNQIITSKIIKK